MAELLSTVRGAITLDIPTLVRFRDAEDVFRRGIIILILVGLVLGAVEFTVGFIGSLVAPSAEAQLAEVRQTFDQMLRFMPPDAAQEFEAGSNQLDGCRDNREMQQDPGHGLSDPGNGDQLRWQL